MLINKLKSIILVGVCCIVSASWSQAQCSESEAELKLNNPSSTLNHFNPTRITNSHDLSIPQKTPLDAQEQELPTSDVNLFKMKEKSRQGYFLSTKVIRYVVCAAVGLGITYWFYPELFTPDFLTVIGTGTVTAITASNGPPGSTPTTIFNPQSFPNDSWPINSSMLDDGNLRPSNEILDYMANIDPRFQRKRITRTSGIVSLSEENINPAELADITPKVFKVVSMRDFILENTQEYETEKYTIKESKYNEKIYDEKITEKFERTLKVDNEKNTEKNESKEGYCPTITKPVYFIFNIVKFFTDAEKAISFFKKMKDLKKDWTQQPEYKYQLIPTSSPQANITGKFYFQNFLIKRNYTRLWNSIEYYKEKFCKEQKKRERKLFLELEHVDFHHKILDGYSYQLVKIFASYKGERHPIEGCDLYLMLEGYLPDTLESWHTPAIIRLKDNYKLIGENGDKVDRVSISDGMSKNSFEALFRDNLRTGKVFMMWDNPIMQDISSKGGHTLKHYKIQPIRHKHRKVPGKQESSQELQIYIEPSELIQIPMKNFPTDNEILVEKLNFKLKWHHDDIIHRSIRNHVIPSYSTQEKKGLHDLIPYDDNEWVSHIHQISHYFIGAIGEPVTDSGVPIKQLCQFKVKGQYTRPDITTYDDGKTYDNVPKELDLILKHQSFEHHLLKNNSYQIVNMFVQYNGIRPIGSYTIKYPLPHIIIDEWNDDKSMHYSSGSHKVFVDAKRAPVVVSRDKCWCVIDEEKEEKKECCLIREEKKEEEHVRLPFYKWDNWQIPHDGSTYR